MSLTGLLRGLRTRLKSLPTESVFSLRAVGLQTTILVLFTLVGSFDVIPSYVTIVSTIATGIWFAFFFRHYDRTNVKITRDGWENFLNGREELGEYEELGGQYEPAGPDDTDDTDEDDDR